MSAHQRARPAGRWLTGVPIETAELELIDSNLEKTINGDLGGAWFNTARIVIGGAGLRIARDADLQDVRTLGLVDDALIGYQSPGKLVQRYVDMSRGVARIVSFAPDPDGPGWVLGADTTTRPIWASLQLGAPLVFLLPLPVNSSIVSVTATLGAGFINPHPEPPDVLSPVEIFRMPRQAATPFIEVLSASRDTFIDEATYIAPHDVLVEPDEPIVVDPAYRYGVRIISESGVEETASILQWLIALRVDLLLTTIDPFVT